MADVKGSEALQSESVAYQLAVLASCLFGNSLMMCGCRTSPIGFCLQDRAVASYSESESLGDTGRLGTSAVQEVSRCQKPGFVPSPRREP